MSGSPRAAGGGRRLPRRRPKAGEDAPFYSRDHVPDANAIRDRVVNKTRAAVRSMETSRPYTPMDRSRGLFGASGGMPGAATGGLGATRPGEFAATVGGGGLGDAGGGLASGGPPFPSQAYDSRPTSSYA